MTIGAEPADQAAGTGRLAGAPVRRRVCDVAELPDPLPAALDTGLPGSFPAGGRPAAVVLGLQAYQALADHPFSPHVEEGGFLVGYRHVIPGDPGRDMLEVTAAPAAQCPDASRSRLTFPGESFLRLGEFLAWRDRGEVLLGWYHTHLFQASLAFGLSDIDVRFHQAVFRRPWQVAALINLHASGRVLRIYQRAEGGDLVEVRFRAQSPAC